MSCSRSTLGGSAGVEAARGEIPLEILRRRRSCFVQYGVSTPEQLFCASRRELDGDFRFGYRFLRWVRPPLSSDAQAQVSEACQAAAHGSDTCVVKRPHEPKLHEKETQLADDLPRPRSSTATARTQRRARALFFIACKKSTSFFWSRSLPHASTARKAGSARGARGTTCRAGSRAPSSRRATFCSPETEWLEPGQAICRNCLAEANARAKDGLPRCPFRFTAANNADPGMSLPETDALTFFEEELLSPIQHIVRIFTLHAIGQCELRGHVCNLFQNGPQHVRQIPALVGDMKMLLVRRCPKDSARKQRVPFLASRRRLEALDRIARPADEGGSLALQPGALTATGYVDLVRRENLQQFADTEAGAEPTGLQVTVTEQQEITCVGSELFAMWTSTSLELQLAAVVRDIHEPANVKDQFERQATMFSSFSSAVKAVVCDEEVPKHPHG